MGKSGSSNNNNKNKKLIIIKISHLCKKKKSLMRDVRKEINYFKPCSNAQDKAQLSLGCTHLSSTGHNPNSTVLYLGHLSQVRNNLFLKQRRNLSLCIIGEQRRNVSLCNIREKQSNLSLCIIRNNGVYFTTHLNGTVG